MDVRLDPPLHNLRVDNRLKVVSGYCGGYQRGIAVTNSRGNDQVTFSGKFPDGCKRYAMDRTALSHNEFAYGLFTSLWRESGGTFEGGWRNAIAPEGEEPFAKLRVAAAGGHDRARQQAQQQRDGTPAPVHARLPKCIGPPGTEAGGRAVVAQWLADHKLASATLAIANGAGLSREARMTATDMASLLRFAWRQPYMPEYLASMSLTGLDGTLSRRFRGSDLVGKAHLKTGFAGSCHGYRGLSAVPVRTPFAVSCMHNHEDIHRGPGEEVQEALLRWLYEQ